MKKFKFLKTEAWPLNRWKMYVDSENIDKETDKIVSTLISVGTFINNCLDTGIEKEFNVQYGKKYVLKSESKQDIIFPEEVKHKKFGKIFETLFLNHYQYNMKSSGEWLKK